ncbi:unnamed protein product [Effrenium voratum]|uniref:Deacetylase sirtuin-type domain-containing protein n=1 Tax=Effrenium voratum TaxID=2562239 RepID=A0AA36JGR9_9DINO|nr:unnamed protein product [Effrenium voratum]
MTGRRHVDRIGAGRLFAQRSHYTVAYTGAGISTAAGIKDYASKASHSRALALVTETSPEQGLTASPTASHRFFAALYRSDLLHHWVQQNHDGLPQKAGYAQEALNEIHGSWFDPSNPVVHFRAELRAANFAWLLEAELRAQLVIAVGTSLCDTPSTADRLVVTCAQRARERQEVCGACVVGLQRTRLDRFAQLRVFCEADRFFELVAQESEGALEDGDSRESNGSEPGGGIMEVQVLAPTVRQHVFALDVSWHSPV